MANATTNPAQGWPTRLGVPRSSRHGLPRAPGAGRSKRRGRGSVGARDHPRRRPGARRLTAGRDRALARPPPRPRTHCRRARHQRRTGAPRERRARNPANARAHRQGPRKRRDATRSATRRVEPRAPRRDRPADDRARRRGRRRRPCVRRTARRPGRAGPAPSPASRALGLRRNRDARDRARDGCSPGDRPLHVDGWDRFAGRGAGRWPSPGVARRRPARLRLAAGREPRTSSSSGARPGRHRECGCCACAFSAPTAAPLRSVDRSCAWSGSCSRSCRCSPASSPCSSPRGDAGYRTFSREPSSSTTTLVPAAVNRGGAGRGGWPAPHAGSRGVRGRGPPS